MKYSDDILLAVLAVYVLAHTKNPENLKFKYLKLQNIFHFNALSCNVNYKKFSPMTVGSHGCLLLLCRAENRPLYEARLQNQTTLQTSVFKTSNNRPGS